MSTIDLTTYAGLQDAIAQFLGGRTDLTGQIPAFIALAEAEILRRLRRKTITKSVTISSQNTALPTDCAELRSVRLVTSSGWRDIPLSNATSEMLAETRANYSGRAARPIAFTQLAGVLVVAPAPDANYTAELQYFEKLVPLSATVATNSVLAEAPDLYLFGALQQAAAYLEHDERIPVWNTSVEKAFAQLETMREREETNASLRPARLPRRFG